MEQTPEQVMRSALDAFGEQSQVDMVLEEGFELGKALLKLRRKKGTVDDVIDEIADGFVVLGQMRLLYGPEAVDARVQVKLARLVRLVADQVAANAEKAKPVKSQPVPGKTLCMDCPHWHPVMDHPSEYGVCHHPSQPWDTAERRAKDGPYLAATNREEACLLPATNPVKPVLRWEADGSAVDLWRGPFRLASVVKPLDESTWASTIGTGQSFYNEQAHAMRATEAVLGLPEVPLWTP